MEPIIFFLLAIILGVQAYILRELRARPAVPVPTAAATTTARGPLAEEYTARLLERQWIPLFRKFCDANLHYFDTMPRFWIFKLKYKYAMSRMTPARLTELAREHLLPYKGHEDALVRYIEAQMGWDPTFLQDENRALVIAELKKYVRVLWELI